MADTLGFKPIGDHVLVMFPQEDWEKNKEGFMQTTQWYGTGYRLDGVVIATGPRTPAEVATGMTVYGDPRTGRVISINGTRFHLMKYADIYMKATG